MGMCLHLSHCKKSTEVHEEGSGVQNVKGGYAERLLHLWVEIPLSLVPEEDQRGDASMVVGSKTKA